MLKERIELEESLDKVISIYNVNKKVREAIKESIVEKGFSEGEVNEVIMRNKSLKEISDILLYLLTKGFYEKTKDESIKLEDYYTPTEILDGNNYIKESVDEKLKYPLIFENVLKGKDDRFLMYWTLDFIKTLFDSEILTYNFSTQRDPKIKMDTEGELIKIANVNKASVKDISDLLAKEDFIYNILSFNLLNDGNDNYEYNAKTNTLTIYSGQINPIDGWHRDISVLNAIIKNPSIADDEFEIRFTNWDEPKCRKFIFQEDLRNKINPHYKQTLNVDKMSNKVVNKLNESTSDIKNKITTDNSILRANKAYTMFDILSNSIDYLWDLQTNMDVNNLASYLGEFFDNIIGYKADDFITSLSESKKISVVTLPAIFVGYLALAKQLQNQENWNQKLFSILDKIDFSIVKQDWIDLKIINRDLKPVITLSKPDIKRIVNYFNKLI